jgi:hypothetical protein
MAWDSISVQPFTLSPAAGDIGVVLEGVQGILTKLGFTNPGGGMSQGPLSGVASWDGNYQNFAMIQYAFVGGDQFIQCVTVANSTAPDSTETDRLVGAINLEIALLTYL